MKTIAVLSRKGGAGKTTVALNLALAARRSGLRVVVADIDPLRSAAGVLRGHPEADSMLVEPPAAKLALLQDVCRQNNCDLLVIDTPPSPEEDVEKAVRVADLCVAVARPSPLDVAAVRQTVSMLRDRKARALVVLNQCPPLRADGEAELVTQAVEALGFGGIPQARTRLRSRLAYQRAFVSSYSVAEWDPSGEAAAEIYSLLAEAQAALDTPEVMRERIDKMRADLRRAPPGGKVHAMQAFLRRVLPSALAS